LKGTPIVRLKPKQPKPSPQWKQTAAARPKLRLRFRCAGGKTFSCAFTTTYLSIGFWPLAAGMTYYSLLAIFPAIAALVAIYGLFSDPSSIASHLDQLGGFLPDGAINVACEQLTRVAEKEAQTLGLTFLVGLGISLLECKRSNEVANRHP
jgi:uncharacterized BrkB/YihY/UPF0761 family membrane protein